MSEKEFLNKISRMTEREFLKTYLLAKCKIDPNKIEELNVRFFIALRSFELIVNQTKLIAENQNLAELKSGSFK